MTPSQVAWAARHDWFVSHDGAGNVTVQDRFTINGGPLQVEYVVFQDFSELRCWAGY